MARFAISEGEPIPPENVEMHLVALIESWCPSMTRQLIPDSEWVAKLVRHLNGLVDLRVNHVRSWLDCNLARFERSHPAIEDIRRRFNNMVIELRTNVQLCGAQCASCNLLCIRSRLHEGDHDCNTNHKCTSVCRFCEDEPRPCSTRYVIFSLRILIAEEGAAPGILASICKWDRCLDHECYPSHFYEVAFSPPTYAENLAHYSEGKAAWRIVRKLVETIGFLTSSCLLTRRSWDTLRMTTTCVLRRFICVARYGPIFSCAGYSSRSCGCTSPAPSKG